MKMHCKSLTGNFREESTTASVADLIKDMVGGKAAHRANTLKLALGGEARKSALPLPQKSQPLRPADTAVWGSIKNQWK